MLHRAREEQERSQEQTRRDAALVLHLAILLRGTRQAREDVATQLTRVAQGQPPDDPDDRADDRADFAAHERALFLTLNEWWAGAGPDDADGG